MSSLKETLLNKIRKHFQAKYQNHPYVLEQLEVELEIFSTKPKVTKHDLDGFEARLNRIALSNRPNRSPRATESPYDSTQRIPKEIDQSTELHPTKIHHQRNRSSMENQTTPRDKPGVYKIIQGRLSGTPGLCDNSLYYMSPMDLSVLKNSGFIDGENRSLGRKKPNASLIEEFERRESPRERKAKSFMVDESFDMGPDTSINRERLNLQVSPFPCLPKTAKMVQRNKMLKEDMWHKIEDLRVKKMQDNERLKSEESKKLTQKWLNDLNSQVQENRKRKETEKMRDRMAGVKHIESETALHQEYIEKEKRYKEYRDVFEKNNQLANMRARIIRGQLDQLDKRNEAYEVEREKQRYEKVVGKERRSHSREVGEVHSLTKHQEDDKPFKAWIQREEKEMAMRQKYVDFLKEKGMHQSSSKELIQEVGNQGKKTGRHMSMEPRDVNDRTLLKFMNLDHNTEVGRSKARKMHQGVNDVLQEQMIDKNVKEIIYREQLKEQQGIWKHKEDQLEFRERLTREAEKLKKMAQKQALDEQIKRDRAMKNGSFTEKEAMLNRSMLKLID